jgi:polyisoprenoid-binding protein YceI
MTTWIGAFALVGALAATPVVGAQTLIPAQSEIVFVSRQMGVPIEGRFRRFDAQLSFDPRRPEAGRVALTIAMASASFAASEAEAEVAKPAWFDSARFPQAKFESTAIKATGSGRYEVAGKLTLKGTTRDLTVPVAIAQSGSNATATGSFVLKRLDWRVGDGEWADTSMVADEVQVRFRFALAGLAAP